MKRNISIILFLIFFFVYAVSPLYHILDPQIDHEIFSTAGPNFPDNNIQILVWEIIFSRLSGNEAGNSDGTSEGSMVLVRKVRAILPHIIVVSSTLQEKAGLRGTFRIYPSLTSLQYLAENKSMHPARTIRSLNPGHSPPACPS